MWGRLSACAALATAAALCKRAGVPSGRARFGDHLPLIRRQDVKGFVNRKPVWLIRPLPLDIVRRQAASTAPLRRVRQRTSPYCPGSG